MLMDVVELIHVAMFQEMYLYNTHLFQQNSLNRDTCDMRTQCS